MSTVLEPTFAFRWERVETFMRERFLKAPTLDSILFLIGVRELGAGNREYSKDEKRDLMHIALCRLLAQSGYYALSHRDADGWPHWELVRPLPFTDMLSQEHLIKLHIIDYFESEGILA